MGKQGNILTRKHEGKHALCIASVASNLDNFNRSNVDILLDSGYEVTLAANFHTKEDINSQEKIDAFAKEMRAKGVYIVHIDFSRKVGNIKQQLKSISQVRQLLKRKYDLIHCHSPICAAIVRILAQKYRRKCGTKVLYTAHGFHFYKGAPVKNWLLFFSVEWLCAHWTDVLITINREDFTFAKRYLKVKKAVYIPGIGIDIERFQYVKTDKKSKRNELGIDGGDFLLLSVGELNRNKNHEIVIRAIAELGDAGIHYMIAGKGSLAGELASLAKELDIERQVHLLGYREDVAALYKCADLYLLPSIREGLNVSLMEAMAGGLPVVCSAIRGNKDLIVDGKGGFLCRATYKGDFVTAIRKIRVQRDIAAQMGVYNQDRVKAFGISNIMEKMRKIYEDI